MAGPNHNQVYDAIIVGVGGMGSATAYQLARRGLRVLGLEQFDIPHEYGSSHGVTRIIRLAYYEDPSYVPLLRRAYELWRELETAAGEQLLHITGSIDTSDRDGALFRDSLHSCEVHDLPHEILTSAELTRRYPAYHLPPNHLALFQPDGGFLLAERCIVAHVVAAQAAGAEIHAREQVRDWQTANGRVTITTDKGTYQAERLVLAAGAWMGELVPALTPLLQPERQVLAWLQPTDPALFAPERFPVCNLTVPEGRYYGFPVFRVPGFKCGRYHHLEEAISPETMDRTPNAVDEAILREFASRYFPAGAGPTMALRTCIFTNTPDEHFIIDTLPDQPEVIVASPCSGHGFKFCPVIGEILADVVQHGATRHNIDLLRLNRFAAAA